MVPLWFGTNFRPDTPGRTREWLRRAQGAGFRALGISDSHALFREPWTMLGLVADAVQVPLGPWVTNPLTRHPTVMASAMATLEEAIPGRAVLGISTGASAVLNVGLKPATLAQLKQYVLAIKNLFQEGVANYQGQQCRLPWARGRRIPIYICAHGPRGLRLAGEIGDGVIAGIGVDAESIARALSLIEEGAKASGRSVDQLDIWFVTFMEVGPSTEEAQNLAAMSMLGLLCVVAWSPTLLETVPPQYREGVRRVAEAYDISQHQTTDRRRLKHYLKLAETLGVKEYAVRRFGIAGTPEDCLGQLREMERAGVRKVWLNMPGQHYPDYGAYVETLSQEVLTQAM